MYIADPRPPVSEAYFWRPHSPWVVERWAVLVSEVTDATEFFARLSAATYLDEKLWSSENQPEPDPEFFDLDSLD